MAGRVPEERVRWPMAQQTWRHVSFLHWRIEPAELRPLLPVALEPDIVDGSAWVSLVAFLVEGFKVLGMPARPSRFPETNLRTYVRDESGRDGVWFMSLDVPSIPNVVGGRLMGTPYYLSTMHVEGDRGTFRYRSRRRVGRSAMHDIVTEPGSAGSAVQGDVAESLAGRWRAFSHVGGLLRVPVEHESWPLRPAHVLRLDETLFRAVGLMRPRTDPVVSYADGLHARLGRPRLVRAHTLGPARRAQSP